MNHLDSFKTYMSILFLELLLSVNTSEVLQQDGLFGRNFSKPVCKQFGNQNHCYFLVKCILRDGWSIQDLVSSCKNHAIVLSNGDECFKIPLASGVAFETREEMQFVMDLITSSDVPHLKAFTSGYWSCKLKKEHPHDFCGLWQDWDSPIKEEITDFSPCSVLFNDYHCPANNHTVHHVLQKSKGHVYWTYISNGTNETENVKKNSKDKIQETVYVACEYEIVRYENCSTTTAEVPTSTGPDVIETSVTSEITKETEYTTASTLTNGVETSETSEITMETENTISSEVVTSTAANSQQITEKHCTLCQKMDDYGNEWIACSGEVVYRSCPNDADGYALWRCGMNGLFLDDLPDYVNCHNKWITDLQQMVEKQVAAEKIIEDFLWDSLDENFFGHEISQLAGILVNTSKLLENQTESYNETYKAEMYRDLVPKLANITNNLMRTETPWEQVNLVTKALYGSKLQDFLYQIGFTLIDAIFSRENQNRFYLEYSYSNLKLGMQLSSPTESTNHLVINYPKDSTDEAGSIAVHGEIKAENDKSPALIASVGTIIDFKTGKRIYPEKMKSWVETTEMLLNSAVISFEFKGLLHNKMKFSKRETNIKPLKIESVIITNVHTISARGPSEQLIRRNLFAGESPTAVLGHAKCVFWDNSSQSRGGRRKMTSVRVWTRRPNKDDWIKVTLLLTQSFGRWDESGCEIISTNETFTTCNCSHLSSFGVFMSIHKYESKGFAMELLSWICSGLSIISLILTLGIFQIFKENLHGERETICRNICSCLLVTHILSLTVLDKTYFNISDASCSCIGAILHYIISSGFMWMAAEGHHLYRLILRVMDGTGIDHRKTYYFISYGLSLLIVGLTAMIGLIKGERAYGNPELCWLSLTNYQWSFISQALLISMVNAMVLMLALRAAVSVGTKSSFKKIGIWLRGWFTLSSLLGVTWFIGIATFNLNIYFEYIFVLLNGLQGVLIFISRILQNEQVWSVVVRKLRKRALLKSFYMNTVSENSSTCQISSSRNVRKRGDSKSHLWNVEGESTA